MMQTRDEKGRSTPLSRRELEVLRLGAQGATDGEISERLSISVPTLRTYWLRIRDKIGGINRTHAIALAVAGPLAADAEADPQRRFLEEVRSRGVAQWAWRPSDRKIMLEGSALDLFEIPTVERLVPVDRLLVTVWEPDRLRFERFLAQSADLAPMTPFEHRIGASGNFRQTVRTVNLATHRSRQSGITVLFASSPSRPVG